MSWKTLFPVYKNQPRDEVFAEYAFPQGRWEHPYALLADKARPEDWAFKRPEYRKQGTNFPILQNYLKNTFLRLQQEDKVSFTINGREACFNTGLVTRDEKELFAVFQRHNRREEGGPDWFLENFYDSYSNRTRAFVPLPPIASYITDASELVFDINYDVDINVTHILDDEENRLRLPPALQSNRILAGQAIQGAVSNIKHKVVRNYKTAIPMWYMPEQKIQLLLPLYLTREDEADLALVADKDKAARVYRIRTALRMDQAYINARLITRPDRDWLNP